MSTPASIAKHPLHPMLVVFPIGLWIFSLIADFIFLLGADARWNDIAFYTIAGGLVGALVAAVPGLFDMFSISDPKVGKIAWNHMILNVIAVAFFALNFYLRLGNTAEATLPILLSVAGVLFIAVSGWLGGELVYVHGMGVQQQSARAAVDERRKVQARRG
jgi:uncharacterized membrane protein